MEFFVDTRSFFARQLNLALHVAWKLQAAFRVFGKDGNFYAIECKMIQTNISFRLMYHKLSFMTRQ